MVVGRINFCRTSCVIDKKDFYRPPKPKGVKVKVNSLKQYRERLLLSKAELSRRARISPLTIDRVEKGKKCRLETKRKIILALGLKLSEKRKIFADEA